MSSPSWYQTSRGPSNKIQVICLTVSFLIPLNHGLSMTLVIMLWVPSWEAEGGQASTWAKSMQTRQLSSIQFSRSVMSNPLWPHGLQHARLPCPSPTPGAYSNSCPLNRWCHPTISSSVVPLSSCLQSFPASGSFSVSQLFASGGQNIGASASASVLPMSIQGWFPLGLTGLISWQFRRLSRVFSNTTVQKHHPFANIHMI